MLRRLAGITGLLLLAAIGLAQSQGYSKNKVDIRAGIVVIDSSQATISRQPLNYTPHVWSNLDSDYSVKPPGWNIYNPIATTQVGQAVVDRWGTLVSDIGGPVPTFGKGLTKTNAAYWEVRLSTLSDNALSQFDVLLVSAYGYTNLNAQERDKLRKFADQGGIVWIDMASSTNFNDAQVNAFPLPVQVRTAGASALTDADIFSPLLTTPYSLSLTNLEQMRLDTTSFADTIVLGNYGMANYAQMESWLESDYQMHFNVVSSSAGKANVLEAKLGDGFVIVTTSEYAMALNRVATGPGTYNSNNQFEGLTPTYDRTTQLAAKFVINMLNLLSTSPQPGAGSRHTSSIAIDIHPPLMGELKDESIQPAPNQAPVLYKGLYVVTAGDTVYVYDAHQRADLDGDGNPDDGVQDQSLGQDFDLLWKSQSLGTNLSGPTCGEVPGSATKDQIFVVGSNGLLYAFDAFDLLNGRINPNQTAATPIYVVNPPDPSSFTAGLPGAGPYAPTMHDGLLYISSISSSGYGFIWMADPVSGLTVKTAGTNEWFVGAEGSATLPEPTGSPTVGLIPIQDNSGGVDRVLYFPGRPTGTSGPNGTATITSLWLGVRGESPPPNSITPNPTGPPTPDTQLVVVTRAARQGLRIYCDNVPSSALANRALGIKLTMLHANGDPFTNTEMKTYFDGSVTESGGILTFPFNGTQTLPQDFAVRIDYTIDWGVGSTNHPAMSTQDIRGQLNLPDDYTITPSNNKRMVIGNLAMSPRGTIYCVTGTLPIQDSSNRFDGGSFYAIREDVGRGGFRLLTRYQLYPDHFIPLNQATPVEYRETLNDNDPVLNFMPPFMQGRFSHLTFVGTPAVHNGVVYVTASGRKTGVFPAPFIPFSILMAFKAEPDAPEIRVGDIPDGFSLRQYDIDRSVSHKSPTATNDMSQGQFSYNRSEGVIRFDNLMTTNRGAMVNAFSTSQPVVIRRTSQPDQLIDPGATSNKWNPLLWYSVMHGVQPTAGPAVSGDSVFVPGNSVIPNLASLIAGGPPVPSGMVEAWKASIPPNDPNLVTDGARPWNSQLYEMQFGSSGPTPNPDILWPQLQGLRNDLNDFMVRARQTKMGKSQTCYGLAVGDGTLAAWGDQGVYTFARADFMIADEGRFGIFDGSGNPVWIADMASSTGSLDVGAVGAVKPLVRPVKGYPVGVGDVIVADAEANRVARIDISGRELRSITDFKVDPNNPPDGYKPNESLKLNSPRDVQLFTSYEFNGTQFWVHYLIADTGNKRLIELVDKYNVNANRQITDAVTIGGVRQIGMLYWHSSANYSGKSFDYNSVSRVYDPGTNRYFYCAGIGSALPSRVDVGLDNPVANPTEPRESAAGNGGVVVFDPQDPNNNLAINTVQVPAIQANTYWDFSTGTYNSQPRSPQINRRMSNVSSVTARAVFIQGIGTRIAIMYTDSTGVYEIVQPTGTGPWGVRWMLPKEAYLSLRHIAPAGAPFASNPMGFRPTYARRLENGDIVVVNSYMGSTRGDGSTPSVPFQGEVLQLSGDFDPSANPLTTGFDFGKPNLGFDTSMVVLQLPPINGARGLILPVFADRR